jgi:hypothetical protein
MRCYMHRLDFVLTIMVEDYKLCSSFCGSFRSLLLPLPSSVQISASTPYSQTPSIYVIPFIRETMFQPTRVYICGCVQNSVRYMNPYLDYHITPVIEKLRRKASRSSQSSQPEGRHVGSVTLMGRTVL